MAKEKSTTEDLDEVREDDGQIYVERDKIDFDPDDGLLSGTAIDGTSDIPDTEGGDNGAAGQAEKSEQAEESEQAEPEQAENAEQ